MLPTKSNTFFDTAMTMLASVGISLQHKSTAVDAILPLISELEKIDPDNALTVGRVMQMSSAFNEVVREQISSVKIGDRYADIAALFDSVRTDTKDMVGWMADGKLDWAERLKLRWVGLRRGSVNDRFNEVRDIFLDVMKDSNQQIQVETQILDAYLQYRYAMKDAETAANHILAKAETALDAAKSTLADRANALNNDSLTPAERSDAELQRDIAMRDVQNADKRYQIALDLVNNLKIAYNTSEVVFARLQQNTDMKRRIQQQSASFFATNETTFTALSAAITGTQGLAESTHALNQMKAGADAALQDLATLGNDQLKLSAAAGYGLTISADAVAALADAIVSYQTELRGLITELRKEASDNADAIADINNQAKERITQLLQEGHTA